MNCFHDIRFSPRAGAILLFCGASIIGPVHSADSIEYELPAGVAASVDESTGRNRVVIQVGADTLAVNTLRASATDRQPRYRLATDALGETLTDAAIELWPESRARDQGSADRTAVVFSSGFTLAASDREVVLFDLGRCATAGDAAVWLPKERTLITGRVTSANRVEATTDTDLVSWINALERLRGLGPSIVIPGQGAPGGAELLTDQIDRLNEMRNEVEDGLLAGRDAATIAEGSVLPWFAAWHRQDAAAAKATVEALVAEVGGLRMPWELAERRWLREGTSPTKVDADWTPPRKVLWRDYWPERLPLLALVAPGVEIVPFTSNEQAVTQVEDADAVIGTATEELLAAGPKL
ncbi:MAG: hypothetical protein IFK93_11195, partial [Acidobacteria bacterium]|nr:hypothetical protein [Candidatus Sulfomarinibacter kjeldsenii]